MSDLRPSPPAIEDSPLVSRRRLLGSSALGAGAVAVGSLGLNSYASAEDADPFDVLRARWVELLTGGDIDPSDPDFAAALEMISTEADAVRTTIDRTADRDQVFTGLRLRNGTSSGAIVNTFTGLRQLAVAWATPGTRQHQDDGVLDDTLAGLETISELAYFAGQTQYGNWYHWEISGPMALNDACALVFDHLADDAYARYAAAVDHFVPDPTWRGGEESTGSNRVLLCQVVGVRGILGRSGDHLQRAIDGLSDVFAFVDSGDGMYADGGFVQHGTVAYTGQYGADFVAGLSMLTSVVAGSAWAVTDPGWGNVLTVVDRGYRPVIVDAEMMDFVRGRAVSRRQGTINSAHATGYHVIESLIRLSSGVDAETRDRWVGMIRGWLERDGFVGILAGASVPRVALVKSVLTEAALEPLPEQPGPALFASMDRVVHRGRGRWTYSIAMASERIAFYECGNGENELGWHQGAGMTYLYNADSGHFDDEFWPTVDRYRLPGTTVDSQELPRQAGGQWGRATSPTQFAGGSAVSGRFASVGQHLAGIESTMRAKKAWFCLDDMVVALGAGISGGSGSPVETVVENRNLHADGTNLLTIDGTDLPTDFGWSRSYANVGWACLAGTGGYVFLDGGAPLEVVREERTGRWRDINNGGPTDQITRRFTTLYLDHGPTPDDARYAYLLLPGGDVATTAATAADPGVHVWANDTTGQGIWVPRNGFVGANFHAAKVISDAGGRRLDADGACSVSVHAHGNRLRLGIADPTHARDAINLVLTWPGLRPRQSRNGSVQVREHGRHSVLVTVDSSARDGRNHELDLSAV
ncbi:polysaccharide lyase 8 family protein [Microlunatus sp. Y2014]|uniref:polysaccharide lyase 8 family protein n=1 Tax=Microlunatus sp. Y2014 TaxID=3418488 RepID=UPI003DA6E847